MGTETQHPGGQPQQTPPGLPGTQPPDPTDPIEQDAADAVPGEEEGDDGDEDETGKIELPGEDRQGDPARPAGNP
jgi:hypothetical protein